MKSGYHYYVTILANDTWSYLDGAPSTMSQMTVPRYKSLVRSPKSSVTDIYSKIYDALVRDESMRTDVDRRLALAVREACQSRCSRAERDAVAVLTDVSYIRAYFGPVSFSTRLCCKWICIMYDRAAKELSRLEADLRVEKQKRHELLMATKAEKAAKDAKDQQGMVKRPDKRKRSQTDESSKFPLKQLASRSGLGSDGTEDEFEELTRLMARWHL